MSVHSRSPDSPQMSLSKTLLHPDTIAVIGASVCVGFAATVLNNLVDAGFEGQIYPVNLGHDELAELVCYPRLDAVPGPVNLALVAVPAVSVPAVLEDCAMAGVAAAIVFASGFAELGDKGRALQNEISAIAARSGMRILGPNCKGMFHQSTRLVASFTGSLRSGLLPSSGVAYVGQCGAILGMAQERGYGLGSWFSTGNEADLSVADITAMLLEKEEVKVIAVYLESVPDGAAWQRLSSRACALSKRVVALRSGQSESGRRAAASHTGAMVRSDGVFGLLNRQFGIIEVTDVDELVEIVAALIADKEPKGPRVAVITSSGGAGSLLPDHLHTAGLARAELDAGTRTELAKLIPTYGSVVNPIDVTAQLFTQEGGQFESACRMLLADSSVDALVVLLTTITGNAATALATGIARLARQTSKHISVVWMASVGETWEARQALQRAGVVVSSSLSRQTHLLSKMSLRAASFSNDESSRALVETHPGQVVLDRLLGTGDTITEATGDEFLDAIGIGRPPGILVATEQEAAEAAQTLGGSLALKIQSPQISHKSDTGGVRLDVDPADVSHVFREILAAGGKVASAKIEGVLIQRMSEPGVGLIVGVQGAREGYPPVLTVGIGGVTAEIYADVVSALAPITPPHVHELLRTLRGWPLLDGHRGRPRVAVGAVVTALVVLSKIAFELGERLGELETNPPRRRRTRRNRVGSGDSCTASVEQPTIPLTRSIR